MRYLKIFLFLSLLSCGKETKTEQQVIQKIAVNSPVKHSKIIVLNNESVEKTEDWTEYENLKSFIDQFQNISSNEAINNSRELNDLVKNLHDSVKPKFLENSSFKARLNLLLNESMRLYDMSSISSIKVEEVNEQVAKLLAAYSSMNSKINTLIRQKKLESEVADEKFTPLFLKDTLTVKKSKKDLERIRSMKASKDTRLKKRKVKLKDLTRH